MDDHRKPVGIATVSDRKTGNEKAETVVALCSDGSVWYLRYPHLGWTPGPPIPGTAADVPGATAEPILDDPIPLP